MANQITSGWGKDDLLFACHRVSDCPAGTVIRKGVIALRCELCGHSVSAAPITAEKSKEPGTHIICRLCMGRVTPGTEIKFLGRIYRGAEKLP